MFPQQWCGMGVLVIFIVVKGEYDRLGRQGLTVDQELVHLLGCNAAVATLVKPLQLLFELGRGYYVLSVSFGGIAVSPFTDVVISEDGHEATLS